MGGIAGNVDTSRGGDSFRVKKINLAKIASMINIIAAKIIDLYCIVFFSLFIFGASLLIKMGSVLLEMDDGFHFL
jgi:hypothetical protein